jgi:hypothetical protein
MGLSYIYIYIYTSAKEREIDGRVYKALRVLFQSAIVGRDTNLVGPAYKIILSYSVRSAISPGPYPLGIG